MRVAIQIIFFTCLLQQSLAQPKLITPRSFQDQTIDPEWVYVKYKSTTNISHEAKAIVSFKVSGHQSGKLYKLRVPKEKDPISFCNELRLSGEYEYADPVIQYQLLATPSDALIENQYYLTNIKAYEAWDITKGDDDITIGIIDSGIDLDHEDISTNLWVNEGDTIDGIDNDENGYIDDYYGYDFADSDTDPSIDMGNHGMIVGGIAGASTNNGRGIAGVGYNSKIAALKGFKSSDGLSRGLYEAIVYAADNGIDVLNLSWGRMGNPLQSEQDIIDYAVLTKDVVIVAAAGNEGGKTTEEEKWYPASYHNVLSVAATDENDAKSSGSTFNYLVDLVAPGVSMFSTVSDNGYSNGGPGTSYAAPQVAAAAALVKDQFPQLSATQIMERIRTTADDIYDVGSNQAFDGKLGKGRLNIYRAVTESNVKSLQLVDYSSETSDDGLLFFGDTVRINSRFINHLSPLPDAFVSISSPLTNFRVIEAADRLGYVNTKDSASLHFDILIDENTAPETKIPIRIDISDGSYQDFEFIELLTSPGYIDFGNERIKMTISGDGNLAFDTYGEKEKGSGFIYQNDTLMSYAGLMIATSNSSVSDNIIVNYSDLSREQDFETLKNYKLYPHRAADYFGYSEFRDKEHPLIIEQSNITWENEDFLIMRYRIINTSDSAINDISVGIYSDWNFEDQSSNYAEYNDSIDYLMTRNSEKNLFAGVQVLGGNTSLYSAIDIGAANGNIADFSSDFTDSLKYDLLVNQQQKVAGIEGEGNDVAALHGTKIVQIPASSDVFVNVIYAISDSEKNLHQELENANDRLEEFILKPRVLETFYTCDGSSFNIDPSSGDLFELYKDPFAEELIASDSIFNITNISSDTLFYVKNIGQGYSSDIFKIRIKLFQDIADFETSTDTLYLDHPTTNVIHFTDQSIDPISWNWNFGNGTSSTLQNPSLSFSEKGTYTVSLTVESSQGCRDTSVKNIIVANRPPPPEIDPVSTCPNQDVIISDPSADKIQVFAFEDQQNPTLSGSSIVIPNVQKDTSIFIAGIYGSLQSDKAELLIDVQEVLGKIELLPDTSSIEHRLMFTARDLAEGASVSWVINGTSKGNDTSVSTEAIEGTTEVQLTINDANGCNRLLAKSIKISSSSFPAQSDLISCNTDSVVIRPSNGTYFGFYEDEKLVNLIKKGRILKTNAFEKVYIVGLDDGLPGMPIEVNIQNERPDISITYTSNPIGSDYQVQLSTETTSAIASYKWYLNGEFLESSAEPLILLNTDINEIALQSYTNTGCLATDTLSLDFTPPLSTREHDESFEVYPNPTSGVVHVRGLAFNKYEFYQIDGKLIETHKLDTKTIDITHLPKGIYLLKVYTANRIFTHQILRN